MKRFDIIICGSGGAGLSLAYYLSKSIWSEKKILLLDKDSKDKNDRTWCFWSKETPSYSCGKSVYWDTLSFEGRNFKKEIAIKPYHYYQINGIDFYDEIKRHLANFPNIVFQQESVNRIIDTQDKVLIHTEKNTYEAAWVFNTIPSLNPTFPKSDDFVKQYFKGFFIKTDRDVFSTKEVKLMDFSQNKTDEAKIQFFYLLPYSSRSALVEYTVFSSQKENLEKYDDAIYRYIHQKFEIDDFEIQSEEMGAIPMTDKKIAFKTSPRVFHLGTAGGMTKATTGYTFQKIQQFCQQFVDNWKVFDSPLQNPILSHARFRFYDTLLLHIIKHHPAYFQKIMECLFQKNDFKHILKFLDEDTLWYEEAQLFASIPWNPFFMAIYEHFIKKYFIPKPVSNRRSIHLDSVSHH